MTIKTNTRLSVLLWCSAWLLAACTSDDTLGPPTHVPPFSTNPSSSTESDASVGVTNPDGGDPGFTCRPVDAQPQPMRVTPFGATETLLSSSDLWSKVFKPNCGACHVNGKGQQGGGLYIASEVELAANLDKALTRIQSDDPAMIMPPGSKPVSKRTAPDPILELLSLLQAWDASNKADLFPDPRGAAAGSDAPLASSPELGKAFTNMGSCVPAANIVATAGDEMDALDSKFAAFAQIQDLPKQLSETDLVSLDSEVLARHGVLSYAPAYTLWADDAKKMRYVRVPRGQSIVFSPANQNFEIPDNTRFYKTFLKEVVDADGNVGFKKMETRLIVVRHAIEEAGQTPQVQALYGTYAWNEEETEAVLEQKPLRNSTPFADDVIWYLTDEQAAKQFIEDPDGLAAFTPIADTDTLSDKLKKGEQLLLGRELARHYAVPGSERCVECHRGGPDGGFVLGFSPLQIRRRPVGEGGVIDPATPDELNQLERFIAYGLITGVAADQVERKVLKLEDSQSERKPRNDAELTAQGYMLGNCGHCHNPKGYATLTAPVLADLLRFYPTGDGGGIFQFPLDRYSPRIQRRTGTEQIVQLPYITPSVFDNALGTQPYDSTAPIEKKVSLAAPWRSLIYRNVETPFTYSADSAIYPHMPLNTPGYDPRAPRIMAEWMLSIPALQKDVVATADGDTADQPMVEILPGDYRYDYASMQAKLRLDQYHASDEYQWKPDTSDIIDQAVVAGASQVPPILVPKSERLNLPNNTHWVELDLTEEPPPWLPRGASWEQALVDQTPSSDPDPEKVVDTARLITLLQTLHADDALQTFAREKVPLALWKPKSGCDFSSQQKVADLPASTDSWWADADKSAAVYMPGRGEAVYGMICINCHGVNADSRGRQADSLLLLTGGTTRVANYRTGLFGPSDSPGDNITRVFGPASQGDTSARDWAMRYLSWMALGGTGATIPQSILDVVANGSVGGEAIYRGASTTANMLSVAKSVCSSLLPENVTFGEDFSGRYNNGELDYDPRSAPSLTSLNVITKNGDADLWREICSYQNPAPIQAFGYVSPDQAHENLQLLRLYPRSAFPANAPVMDQHGVNRATGLSDQNLAPWCVLGSADSSGYGATPERMDAYYNRLGLARCPSSLTAAAPFDDEAKRLWSLHGAVNAGRIVFQYAEDLTSGKVQPQLDYTQCDKLQAATP